MIRLLGLHFVLFPLPLRLPVDSRPRGLLLPYCSLWVLFIYEKGPSVIYVFRYV